MLKHVEVRTYVFNRFTFCEVFADVPHPIIEILATVISNFRRLGVKMPYVTEPTNSFRRELAPEVVGDYMLNPSIDFVKIESVLAAKSEKLAR